MCDVFYMFLVTKRCIKDFWKIKNPKHKRPKCLSSYIIKMHYQQRHTIFNVLTDACIAQFFLCLHSRQWVISSFQCYPFTYSCMRLRTELVLIYHTTYRRSNKTILTLKFLNVGAEAVSVGCFLTECVCGIQ